MLSALDLHMFISINIYEASKRLTKIFALKQALEMNN